MCHLECNTPLTQIITFCSLSQNYQQFFWGKKKQEKKERKKEEEEEKKNPVHLKVNCPRNPKIALEST